MKNYISKLIKLIEDERDAEISIMESEIKRLSSYEREKKGRAINNLKGKFIGDELGYKIVQYGRVELINSEINVGDLVLVSKGNPLKSDLVGTVTEMGKRFVKVAFEGVPRWALKKKVRVDLYVSDVSYRRMEDNLKNLSIYGVKALNFMLKKEYPKDIGCDVVVDGFNDVLLNDSQKDAVNLSLNTDDFFLIHGPFGTGKTRTLLEVIFQEIKLGHKVLATGESNTSVDNLLDGLDGFGDCGFNFTRLGHPQRVSEDNIKYTLAYKVEHHPMNSRKMDIKEIIDSKIKFRDEYSKPTPRYRRGFSDDEILMNAREGRSSRGISVKRMKSMASWIEVNREIDDYYKYLEEIEAEIIDDIIEGSDVILSTNSSAALDFINGVVFDVCVVDEASQASIPSVLIPISKSRRFVLAGDHKQLPPTVVNFDSRELEETLFESLILSFSSNSSLLDCQYRMNGKLMMFSNMEFYEGKLFSDDFVENISLGDLPRVSLSYSDRELLGDGVFDDGLVSRVSGVEGFLDDVDYPFLFFDTSLFSCGEGRFKDSKSFYNRCEAEIVGIIVSCYLKWGFSSGDIGVISPYMDQVDLIKSFVDVEVKSVDGFQGREKEIIIISMVRSNSSGVVGFLNDYRRLNVAVTRAKRKLVIVGDCSTLCSVGVLCDLVDFCESMGYKKSI